MRYLVRRETEVFDLLRGVTHSTHSSSKLAWGMADQMNGDDMNERDRRICDRYEDGDSSTVIAADEGITPQRVRQILQERGVETRDPRESPLPREEIVAYYEDDHTIRETAEHFGCSPSSVHRALKAAEGE